MVVQVVEQMVLVLQEMVVMVAFPEGEVVEVVVVSPEVEEVEEAMVLVVVLVLVVVVTKFLAKGNFHKQERQYK